MAFGRSLPSFRSRVVWLVAASLVTSCTWARPSHAEEAEKWEEQIAAFEAQDRRHRPVPGGVLFVGSSSIRRWDLPKHFPDLPVVNRGFGGSHVADSLRYADRIILPHKPRVVVVYAGDNDINAGKCPQQVRDDYSALVSRIRSALPSTRIVYISIKPSIKRWHLVGSMRMANRLIREIAQRDSRLEYVDVDTPMIGHDGRPMKELFDSDGLHLSDRGYRLWSDVVRSHLGRTFDCWPQFRGPHGNGHAKDATPPLRWSEEKHVRWKTTLHGQGWSSPVVWGRQIWTTTASVDGKDMYALCIDSETGRIVHDLHLFHNRAPREKHALNSYASPTPVVESGRVYVHFGSYGTACLDTGSGKTIWARRDLPCNHWRGPGSSPILFENLLIIHFDGYDFQYVVALDKHTGQTVWKVDRNIDYGTDDGDLMKAFCTPIVIESAGRVQLISPASKAAVSYDPRTGQEWWRVRFPEFSSAARPVYGRGRLLINTGFSRARLLAVRPDGRGDVTDSHVQWVASKGIGSKPSPLLIDDRVYVLHDRGTVSCLAATTGRQNWSKRLGGNYSASPLYAGGHVYFFSHEGTTTVIQDGDTFRVVAENILDDGFMASPAVVGDALIVKTRSHLYRIEKDGVCGERGASAP